MLGLRHYMGTAIDLFQGEITEFVCDAMVTAAKTNLAAEDRLSSSIYLAAGPSILEEYQSIAHKPLGSAVLTKSGNLPAKVLIHAIRPTDSGHSPTDTALLKLAYQQSLQLALDHHQKHIALPSLGSEFDTAPLEQMASLAMEAIKEFLDSSLSKQSLRRITLVLNNRQQYMTHQKALFECFPELDEAIK